MDFQLDIGTYEHKFFCREVDEILCLSEIYALVSYLFLVQLQVNVTYSQFHDSRFPTCLLHYLFIFNTILFLLFVFPRRNFFTIFEGDFLDNDGIYQLSKLFLGW